MTNTIRGIIGASIPDVVFAHEFGHVLGLEEEYCSTEADGHAACNNPAEPNLLNAADGCDPTSTSCCSIDFRNPNDLGAFPHDNTPCAGELNVCCLGNSAVEDPTAPILTNDPTGRCVMSSSFAPGPRRFCRKCLEHLESVGAECSVPFSGQERILLVQGTVGPDDFKLHSFHALDSGRVGLQNVSPRTTGDVVVEFSRVDTGAVLATRGLLAPWPGNSEVFGSDGSVELRVPLPDDLPATGAIRVRTIVGGSVIDQTTINGQPPTAVVGDVTAECSSPAGTMVTVDASSSSDPDGDTLSYEWDAGSVVLDPAASSTPSGVFPLGSTLVTLTVSDGSGVSSSSTATAEVVDTTPPVLSVPPNVTRSICKNSTEIDVGQAIAEDACSTSVTVTGTVVASDGVPLTTPIAVVGGLVTLGPGVHTIVWSASDGLQSTEATQTVAVGASIQASQRVQLETAATIRSGSGYGTLYNAGTGLAQIGNDARVGDILSVGRVEVGHRAYADNIRSATSVFIEPDGHALTQTVGPVTLPAMPALPSFTVPAGDGIIVTRSHTLSPGSYASITANSGSTLILSSGDYFIGTLSINTNVALRAQPDTRVFVLRGLDFRSSFTNSSGNLLPVHLGFAGTTMTLEAPFNGMLVAPNATVQFGMNTGLSFAGSFYAKVLWLRPNSSLVCLEG